MLKHGFQLRGFFVWLFGFFVGCLPGCIAWTWTTIKHIIPSLKTRETALFQEYDRYGWGAATIHSIKLLRKIFQDSFHSPTSVQLKYHIQQCHNTITTKGTKYLCGNIQGLILGLLHVQWHILSLQMAPILFRNNTLGLVCFFFFPPKNNELKFFSCAEEVATTAQNLFRQAVEKWGLNCRQNK